MNVLALAIKLSPIFLLPHGPFPLLFGALNLFLNLHSNRGPSLCGSLRFFRILLSLGGGFPPDKYRFLERVVNWLVLQLVFSFSRSVCLAVFSLVDVL